MSGLYSKFVIKENKDDVVHSSGYGVAQNSGAIGSSSSTSFSERMRIDNNRSRIRRYGESKVATAFRDNQKRASIYQNDKKVGAGNDSSGQGGMSSGIVGRRGSTSNSAVGGQGSMSSCAAGRHTSRFGAGGVGGDGVKGGGIGMSGVGGAGTGGGGSRPPIMPRGIGFKR